MFKTGRIVMKKYRRKKDPSHLFLKLLKARKISTIKTKNEKNEMRLKLENIRTDLSKYSFTGKNRSQIYERIIFGSVKKRVKIFS